MCYFIAYNAATGEVHFDRVHADGKGYDLLSQTKWATGSSLLMPFVSTFPVGLPPQAGLIAYNAKTGSVRFERFLP